MCIYLCDVCQGEIRDWGHILKRYISIKGRQLSIHRTLHVCKDCYNSFSHWVHDQMAKREVEEVMSE